MFYLMENVNVIHSIKVINIIYHFVLCHSIWIYISLVLIYFISFKNVFKNNFSNLKLLLLLHFYYPLSSMKLIVKQLKEIDKGICMLTILIDGGHLSASLICNLDDNLIIITLYLFIYFSQEYCVTFDKLFFSNLL